MAKFILGIHWGPWTLSPSLPGCVLERMGMMVFV